MIFFYIILFIIFFLEYCNFTLEFVACIFCGIMIYVLFINVRLIFEKPNYHDKIKNG